MMGKNISVRGRGKIEQKENKEHVVIQIVYQCIENWHICRHYDSKLTFQRN